MCAGELHGRHLDRGVFLDTRVHWFRYFADGLSW
jgi:hypothetical protein